jgi:hypothetical protein
MADVIEREYYFSDEFLPRYTERLQMALNSLKNKTEISEADMVIVEEAHRTWFNDYLGWRKEDLSEGKKQLAVQVGLFDDKTVKEVASELTKIATTEICTEVEVSPVVIKKRKRK